MNVDFIVVGPGRSGTSWLFKLLEEHHHILMPDIKETEYFNNNFHKGDDWYHSHFNSSQRSKKIIGEISNMYYCDFAALKRIKKYNPSIKIIFNYRNPLDLLYSFIMFGRRRGLAISAEKYLHTYPYGMLMGSGYTQRLKKARLSHGDVVSIIEAVKLSKYLELIFNIFRSENIFILNYEDLSNDPAALASEIFYFLGVEDKETSNLYKKINAVAVPRQKSIASFASSFAYYLRRFGFNRQLTYLHNSNFVKKILFKKEVEINFQFSKYLQSDLVNENIRIKKFLDRTRR
jgi:hypothetical protein